MSDGPYYLIDVTREPGDRYVVEIDSDNGVDIDYCVSLSQAIEAEFPRDNDEDDYELEVGSAGLTSPFKVHRQYVRNIGQEVEVLTNDGKKLRGMLRAAGDDTFTIDVTAKERPEGAKKPVEVTRSIELPYNGVRSVRLDLKF